MSIQNTKVERQDHNDVNIAVSTGKQITSKDDEEAINHRTSDEFQIFVVQQTVCSIKLAWSLIPNADVYEIEKFHKRRGWEIVAWKSLSPALIENLEDNFAYRLRIQALCYDEACKEYKIFKTSEDIVARTSAAQPTTLCLHRAIKKGQQFLVKRILRRRPRLIAHPGPNGYLPLANAIAYGENCVVDVLLTAGACVHTGNTNNGRTPLHLAFFHGRLPFSRILLNKKAQLEAIDANGMTACHFAIDANQLDMLRFGLENHANTEAADACGWTLLLRAVVMGGNLAMLKLLVLHGADRNVLDKLGQSCSDLARLYRNEGAKTYFEHLSKRKTIKM